LSKAKAKPSIDKQFAAFKNLVRKIIDRAYLPVHQADLFRPSKVISDNLASNGLSGRQPALSFNIFVEQPIQEQIAAKLLNLGAFHKKTDVTAFLQGEKRLAANPLNLKGKHKWDNTIPLQHHHNPEDLPIELFDDDVQDMYNAICTKCGAQSSANRMNFTHTELDHSIKCPSCSKTSLSRHWHCSCKIPWHLCNRHLPCPIQVETKATPSKASASQPGYHTLSPRKVLDQELIRESKLARRRDCLDDEDLIDLEPLPTQRVLHRAMLPASLRDRFPHVCAAPVHPPPVL
jgi:DNA-directed RNA polymerase subunit RPC12/RpoP